MNEPEKRKPGRKPLPPGCQAQQINFRIPVKLLAQLEAIADQKSGELGFTVNRTQLVILALKNYVETHS